jgi:hypothetical protein
VRFDLAVSGIPDATPSDVEFGIEPPVLTGLGPYGDPRLIERIAQRYGVDPRGVVPVPGASSGVFIALACSVPIGSKVLMEQPVYQPILRVAKFLNLEVVPLRRSADGGFEICSDEVAHGLEQGAGAVVLTNLHNPSGQLIPIETLSAIAERCKRSAAVLIVDEVYLDAVSITRSVPRWSAAGLSPHVVAVNSLTKIHGLSGLRLGWLLMDPVRAERARDMMDLLSVNNAAPSSALALQAFDQLDRLEARYRDRYHDGQSAFRAWLAGEPRIRGYPNQGALFEWVRLPAGCSADRLCERLVREYDTLVTPGSFFESDDHVRVGLGVATDLLSEALSRVSLAIRESTVRTGWS